MEWVKPWHVAPLHSRRRLATPNGGQRMAPQPVHMAEALTVDALRINKSANQPLYFRSEGISVSYP